MLEFGKYLVVAQNTSLMLYEQGTLVKVLDQRAPIITSLMLNQKLYVQTQGSVTVYNDCLNVVHSLVVEGTILTDGSQLLILQAGVLLVGKATINLGLTVPGVVARNGYALAFEDMSMCLVNLNSGKTIMIEHTQKIVIAQFHPTKDCLAVGDVRGQITLFEFKSIDQGRYKQRKLHWHPYAIQALYFSTDGNYLYSGGQECVLVRWHLESKAKSFLPRTKAPIDNIMQSQNGNVVVTLEDNSINSLTPVDWSVVYQIRGVSFVKSRNVWNHQPLSSNYGSMAYDAQGNAAVLTSVPGSLQFWSLKDNKHQYEVQVCPRPRLNRSQLGVVQCPSVTRCEFSLCGVWMATVDEFVDDEVQSHLMFWKRVSGNWTLVTTFPQPHDGIITGMQFGKVLGSCVMTTISDDGLVKHWQLQQREQRLQPNQSQDVRTYETWCAVSSSSYRSMLPTALAFSADCSVLAVAFGKVIILWDPIKLQVCKTLVAAVTNVRMMMFDCKEFLVVTTDDEILLWNLLERQVVWSKVAECTCLLYQNSKFVVGSADMVYEIDPSTLQLNSFSTSDLVGLASSDVFLNSSFEFQGLQSTVDFYVNPTAKSLLSQYMIVQDVVALERQQFKTQRSSNLSFGSRSSHMLPGLTQMLSDTVAQLMPKVNS